MAEEIRELAGDILDLGDVASDPEAPSYDELGLLLRADIDLRENGEIPTEVAPEVHDGQVLDDYTGVIRDK